MFKDEMKPKEYAQIFIELLQEYYNINRLKINSEKTTILLFRNSLSSIEDDNLTLTSNGGEVIKPVRQHKILGWTINNHLTMDTHLSNTIRTANMKLHNMRSLLK